ncbi:MAG: FeoA family protein [Gemmatimonadales bacterium]|nr:FeoA family protein [Gemmatimonadales bacterium]
MTTVLKPQPTFQPDPATTCALAACEPGIRARIVALCCGSEEACRLRALGVSEGAPIEVIDRRHSMVVNVRGTRLALGSPLTATITVQPLALA